MNDPLRVLRVRVCGPLAPFASGYAADLLLQGYKEDPARHQLQLMAHLSRWLAASGVGVHELEAIEVERFMRERKAIGYTSLLTPNAVAPLLAYLRRLNVAPTSPLVLEAGPVEDLLARFRHYLLDHRGVSKRTAVRYASVIRPFVQSKITDDHPDSELNALCAAEIHAFIVSQCADKFTSNAQFLVTAMRSLLRFLHLEGRINQSLVFAVPSVAGWRLSGLPKAIEASEIGRLLASCDRRTPRGRRDFAILTLLARLGLRVGEVAGLQLEDIDWRSATVALHGKGNHTDLLPLPVDVGEAVSAYLRRGRPAERRDRALFLRVKAPITALTSDGVRHVVVAAARRAGLDGIHAHRLRHTVATQMLRAGAALPEIGQVLRHQRAMTTSIYAKVDRDALRTIARPWPGAAA